MKQLLLLFGFLFTAFACTPDSNEQAADTDSFERIPEDDFLEGSNLSMEQRLLKLSDSVDTFRDFAFSSEETKIESIKELMAEVETSFKNYDRQRLNELRQELAKMEQMRYTAENYNSEPLMLAYDAQNEKVTQKLSEFVGATPEFEKHQRARLFYNDIMQAEAQDFDIRRIHNELAREYNTLLREAGQQGEKPTFYGD
jgi:hypothetical protein